MPVDLPVNTFKVPLPSQILATSPAHRNVLYLVTLVILE
jgi:hypothetical protein